MAITKFKINNVWKVTWFTRYRTVGTERILDSETVIITDREGRRGKVNDIRKAFRLMRKYTSITEITGTAS